MTYKDKGSYESSPPCTRFIPKDLVPALRDMTRSYVTSLTKMRHDSLTSTIYFPEIPGSCVERDMTHACVTRLTQMRSESLLYTIYSSQTLLLLRETCLYIWTSHVSVSCTETWLMNKSCTETWLMNKSCLCIMFICEVRTSHVHMCSFRTSHVHMCSFWLVHFLTDFALA